MFVKHERKDSRMDAFKQKCECPWCGKSRILMTGTADQKISTQCPKCKNYYTADLRTCTTTKSRPRKS